MFTNEEIKTLVINMAMGKPGIAQRIHTLIEKDEELQATLITLIQNLSSGNNIFKAYEALQKIYKY